MYLVESQSSVWWHRSISPPQSHVLPPRRFASPDAARLCLTRLLRGAASWEMLRMIAADLTAPTWRSAPPSEEALLATVADLIYFGACKLLPPLPEEVAVEFVGKRQRIGTSDILRFGHLQSALDFVSRVHDERSVAELGRCAQEVAKSHPDLIATGRPGASPADTVARALYGGAVVALVDEKRPGKFLLLRPLPASAAETAMVVAAAPPSRPMPRPETKQKTWVGIVLTDEDGKPVGYQRYKVTLPDGSVREGRLNFEGRARIGDLDPGNCQITFPDLDAREWRAA